MIQTTYRKTQENKISETVYSTSVNGVLYIQRSMHSDDRGFFSEAAQIPSVEAVAGIDFKIKQINHASSKAGVARGIHAEDWNKLVFVTSGKCFCAVADVRPGSKTYGTVETFLLGFDDESMQGTLFLPAGVGNSVVALEPLHYIYFVDKLYSERNPAGDIAISLFDQDLNIQWPIAKEDMIISERDRNSVMLKDML